MASFVVMRAKDNSAVDDVHFVRDGFAVFALALPLVWLVWHRLWLQAAIWFGASGLIAAFTYWSANPLAPWIAGVATVLINLTVAFEGGNWVKQSLETGGYVETEVITARSLHRAEEIFASRFETFSAQISPASFQRISNLIPLSGSR